MKLRRIRSTIRGPLILFVTSMVLVVALLVLWNVVLTADYQRIRELTSQAEEAGGAFHWTFIALGSVFFVAIITLFSVLGSQLFAQIRYNQRLASFVATFTHELNSPLASIKMFAQTLRKPGLPPEEHDRFLELILVDVERLHTQLQNVLRSVQVDSPHGLQVAPEAVAVRGYLEAIVAARQAAAERLDADVTIRLADGPSPWARLDRQVFRQALDNLIDNAIKYRRPNAPVNVELAVVETPDAVAVEVRDDGCGIEPDDLERVFERYERGTVTTAAGRQAGAGLGLWIVAAVADAHGGDVDARSDGSGRGTTFRLTVPRVEPRRALAPSSSPEEAP